MCTDVSTVKMHHPFGVSVNNNTAVRLLSLQLTHASPARDKHDSLSHSAMGETEFDLCLGQRSKQYIQVAPSDPQSSHPLVAVSVSLSLLTPGPRQALGRAWDTQTLTCRQQRFD